MGESEIPLCVPELRGRELEYLRECVETNWVSYVGPFVNRFEAATAAYVGAQQAVATNSGTAALHVALLVAGIQPGDEVLVSDLTFIAPANAVRYAGAVPVFMDVTADTWQMDPQKVRDFLERECTADGGRLVNRRTGRPVTAMIPVDILGHPVELDALIDLARRFDLRIIEDATEALGATYRGRRLGALADLTCFSYNGNKIITCGGGGMLTTDNTAWAERARYLTTQARDHAIEYVHDSVGYNYRLTNIQAAVGLAQMERLDECLGAKRAIAGRYHAALRDRDGITLQAEAPWAQSTWWLYTVLLDPVRTVVDSRAVVSALGARRIQARPLWSPIHEQRPYRDCPAYRIEIAPRLCAQSVSLPSSVGLTEADQTRVIEALSDMLAASPGAAFVPA